MARINRAAALMAAMLLLSTWAAAPATAHETGYAHTGNCTMWGHSQHTVSPYKVYGVQASSNCSTVQLKMRTKNHSGNWTTSTRTDYDGRVTNGYSAVDMAWTKHNAKYGGVWGGLTLWH
ncbi:MAG: hypothetical protein AAGA37_13735 [Actinomycetota bacterium]